MKAATGQAGREPVARRPRYVYHYARIPGVLRATYLLIIYGISPTLLSKTFEPRMGRAESASLHGQCSTPCKWVSEGSWYPRGCQDARSKLERTLFPPIRLRLSTQYRYQGTQEDRKKEEERALSAESESGTNKSRFVGNQTKAPKIQRNQRRRRRCCVFHLRKAAVPLMSFASSLARLLLS